MTATSRLELRLPAEAKAEIERAAALSGTSVTRFALDTLLARARELTEGAPATPPARRPLGGWSFELPDGWDGPIDDFADYR